MVCTALIAVTDTKKDDHSSAAIGVNFPGVKQVKDDSTCTDQGGKQRGADGVFLNLSELS